MCVVEGSNWELELVGHAYEGIDIYSFVAMRLDLIQDQ
jgi:hypothetical protein